MHLTTGTIAQGSDGPCGTPGSCTVTPADPDIASKRAMSGAWVTATSGTWCRYNYRQRQYLSGWRNREFLRDTVKQCVEQTVTVTRSACLVPINSQRSVFSLRCMTKVLTDGQHVRVECGPSLYTIILYSVLVIAFVCSFILMLSSSIRGTHLPAAGMIASVAIGVVVSLTQPEAEVWTLILDSPDSAHIMVFGNCDRGMDGFYHPSDFGHETYVLSGPTRYLRARAIVFTLRAPNASVIRLGPFPYGFVHNKLQAFLDQSTEVVPLYLQKPDPDGERSKESASSPRASRVERSR